MIFYAPETLLIYKYVQHEYQSLMLSSSALLTLKATERHVACSLCTLLHICSSMILQFASAETAVKVDHQPEIKDLNLTKLRYTSFAERLGIPSMKPQITSS